MYASKTSNQVASDVQVAARSCVPTPIILEISDDDNEQLTAKVKQQQPELKKAMDVLEHARESKRKAAEEAAERKHEEKAAQELEEMVSMGALGAWHVPGALHVGGKGFINYKHH